VFSDLGAKDPTVRQVVHGRGILTIGIPKTIERINPTADAILVRLNKAGLNCKRTP
jgi:hypothetical protein